MRCGEPLIQLTYSLMAVKIIYFARVQARHCSRHSIFAKMKYTVRDYGFTKDDFFRGVKDQVKMDSPK